MRLSGIVAFIVLTLAGSVAEAQAPESPSARADRLFRDGKAALEANRFDEACPKLAESQQLDPGTGTLLALALCHEGNGQTATAWRELHEVYEASRKRPDRATLAQKHIKSLDAKLSHLTVSFGDASQKDGMHVRIDGVDFPRASWDVPVPFDPGDHTIEATLPGATAWTATVHLGKEADAKTVVIPKLEPPVVVVAPPPPPPPASDRHLIGWVVGGSGAAILVVGGVFGGIALHDHSSATALCPSATCASTQGVTDNNRAKTEAWVSDFGVGVGLAGIAVGTYLLLTHGDAPPTTGVRVTPGASGALGGLSLTGAW